MQLDEEAGEAGIIRAGWACLDFISSRDAALAYPKCVAVHRHRPGIYSRTTGKLSMGAVCEPVLTTRRTRAICKPVLRSLARHISAICEPALELLARRQGAEFA